MAPLNEGRKRSASPEQWVLVAEGIKERRAELGLSIPECVERSLGAISQRVWAHLEAADQEGYTNRTLLGVCTALGWSHDSIRRLLAGDEPYPLAGFESDEANYRTALTESQLRELLLRDQARERELAEIRSQLALLRQELLAALGRRATPSSDPRSPRTAG